MKPSALDDSGEQFVARTLAQESRNYAQAVEIPTWVGEESLVVKKADVDAAILGAHEDGARHGYRAGRQAGYKQGYADGHGLRLSVAFACAALGGAASMLVFWFAGWMATKF